MKEGLVKLFLRLAISVGFLSAVADRFGLWPAKYSAWGSWDNFVDYTGQINPWFSTSVIPVLAIIATAAEVIFAVFLIIGYKTELFAKLSGALLLIFALSMTFSSGIKAPLDYSVFTASGAAFAIAAMKSRFLELG